MYRRFMKKEKAKIACFGSLALKPMKEVCCLRSLRKKLHFLTFFSFPKLLAPVFRKVYNAIQRIAIGFSNTYPLDSDLFGG